MIWTWLGCGAATMLCMEGWAALLHHRLWHGVLWGIHITHHRRRGDVAHRRGVHLGAWETNDLLSLIHAPVAIALILFGCVGSPGFLREAAYGIGLGMTCYGIAYVLVHDGLVHGRLPVRGLLRFGYMRQVRAAHGLHHRTGGPPFGMFFGPWHPAFVKRSKYHRHKALKQRVAKSSPLALTSGR